ncbi:MAG: LytTR family DNA-binding domain-containing protein [Rikenellaceae bacterium]
MKVVIIEDEKRTANKLAELLCRLYPNVEIVCNLTSVSESIEWFRGNAMPDLVFMDIRLSDDIVFLIFDSVDITCPIIFTTAYDEFALKAFEVTSIDYLLKPIDETALRRAMDKYNLLVSSNATKYDYDALNTFIEAYNLNMKKQYSQLILVENKDKLIPMRTSEIAFLYFLDKSVSVVMLDGSKSIINNTLDYFMQQLDPSEFYRANRQFIIARKAVKDLTMWFNCRLVVNLTVETGSTNLQNLINTYKYLYV